MLNIEQVLWSVFLYTRMRVCKAGVIPGKSLNFDICRRVRIYFHRGTRVLELSRALVDRQELGSSTCLQRPRFTLSTFLPTSGANMPALLQQVHSS